jgi:ribosomal protein L14
MMHARENHSANSQLVLSAMVVLRNRSAHQRTDYDQIGFDRQAKSELNKGTQTVADGGCSI